MHESAHDIYERSLAFVKKTVSIMERIWVVRVCVPSKRASELYSGALAFCSKGGLNDDGTSGNLRQMRATNGPKRVRQIGEHRGGNADKT